MIKSNEIRMTEQNNKREEVRTILQLANNTNQRSILCEPGVAVDSSRF